MNAVQIAPPISAAHLADQRVDAAAEDVADDEEQQQAAGDDPAQPRPFLLFDLHLVSGPSAPLDWFASFYPDRPLRRL